MAVIPTDLSRTKLGKFRLQRMNLRRIMLERIEDLFTLPFAELHDLLLMRTWVKPASTTREGRQALMATVLQKYFYTLNLSTMAESFFDNSSRPTALLLTRELLSFTSSDACPTMVISDAISPVTAEAWATFSFTS